MRDDVMSCEHTVPYPHALLPARTLTPPSPTVQTASTLRGPSPPSPSPPSRSPALEAGRLEAGRLEAGRLEAGRLEAGRLEAGRLEAGRLEAGVRVLVWSLCSDSRSRGHPTSAREDIQLALERTRTALPCPSGDSLHSPPSRPDLGCTSCRRTSASTSQTTPRSAAWPGATSRRGIAATARSGTPPPNLHPPPPALPSQGCRFVTTRCGAYPTLPPPAFVYDSPPAEWPPPVPTDPALSLSLCAGPVFWRSQGSDAQTTILRDKCAAGVDPCSYSPNGSAG